LKKPSTYPAFNLLVLRCTDIRETKYFYESLGLAFEEEQHGKGPIHFSSTSLGFVLELYPSSTKYPTDQTRLGFSFHAFEKLPDSIAELFSPHQTTIILHDPDHRKVEITIEKQAL